MATGKSRAALVARVGLEGGDDFLRDLKQLGLIGEKAFKDIEKAARDVRSMGRLQRAAKAVQAEFRNINRAGREFGRSMATLGGAVQTVGRNLAIAGGAAVAAGAGIFAVAKSAANAADEQIKLAQSLGLTITEYGQLQFAAEQGGVATEQFQTAFTRFNRTILDAVTRGGRAAETFKELGVSLTDAEGNLRSNSDILADVADAFQRLPDGAEKAALATELFSRSGARLIPLLNGGSEGLRELAAQAEALGLTFTELQAKQAEEMNDALNRLSRAAQGARNQLGLIFAPGIARGADALVERLKANRDAVQDFVQSIANRAIPVVEDLFALLQGRDADVQNLWILEARDAVVAFGRDVQAAIEGIVIPAFNALVEIGRRVADALNAVLGTDFSGRQVLIGAAVLKLTGLFTALAAAIGVVRSASLLMFTTLKPLAIIALNTPLGRLVFLLASVAGGALYLRDQWNAAERATQLHKEAVDRLDGALQAVRDGVPGSIRALAQLSSAELRAAEAAVQAAEARLQALREVERGSISPFNLLSRALTGKTPLEIFAERELGALRKGLQDTRSEIQRVTTIALRDFESLGSGAAAALDPAGDAVDDLGNQVERLGDTVEETGNRIRIFGPGGQLRADLEKKAGKTVLDDTEEDADDATDAVKRTEKAVESLTSAVSDPSLNLAKALAPGDIITSVEKVQAVSAQFRSLLADIREGTAEATANVGDADATDAVREMERLRAAIEPVATEVDAVGERVNAAFAAIGTDGATTAAELEAAFAAAAAGIKAEFAGISGAAGDDALQGGAGGDSLGGGGPFAALTAEIERLQQVLATVDFSAMRNSGIEAFTAIEERARSALAAIQEGIAGLGGAAAAAGEEGEERGGGGDFSGLVTAADAAWSAIRAGAQQLTADILAAFQAIIEQVAAAFAALGETIAGVFVAAKARIDDIAAQIRAVVASLIAEMQRLEAAAEAALSAANAAQSAGSGSGGGGGFGFAHGGYLATGPGTSTSDSIWARLSRGEFVISARAVAHFGPAFFDQLNRLRLPAFSLGGIADGIASTLAGVGRMSAPVTIGPNAVAAASGPTTVLNLTLERGDGRRETFAGLTGPRETMNDLIRAVHTDQLGSAGRKPGWYK